MMIDELRRHPETFEVVHEVPFQEFNREGALKCSAFARMLEGAGAAHDESVGFGDFELRKTYGYTWVLSGLHIAVLAPLREGDRLSVFSWRNGTQGAAIVREAAMYRLGEEAVIGRASMSCVLVHEDSLRPVNPRKFIQENSVTFAPELSHLPDLPRRKIELPESMEAICSRTVYYDDIDMNKHLNNLRYIDFLTDAAIRMSDRPIAELDVLYRRQVFFDQCVEMRGGILDHNTLVIEGVTEGVQSFIGQIRLL